MDDRVSRIAAESGELKGVVADGASERDGPRHGFGWLALEFNSGVLLVSCDDDTDELLIRVDGMPAGQRVSDHELFRDLIGLEIEYAWEGTNQHGYSDLFQLRMIGDPALGEGMPQEIRQFEAVASMIEVRRVLSAT
ncbi:MAG: DUF6334 family protein [Solirubrobacterales bacterium]